MIPYNIYVCQYYFYCIIYIYIMKLLSVGNDQQIIAKAFLRVFFCGAFFISWS
jgi:hypothetical protein